MTDLAQISQALRDGDMQMVKRLTQQALEEQASPQHILNDGLIAGMDVVGTRFKAGEIFLPEVLVVARAMQAGLDILKPLLTETGAKPVGKVVLGTVRGDLHDIGKNLVGMMLQGAGFEVIDIGVDVPPGKFVEEAGKDGVQIVAMSALLTTTMPSMQMTIDALRKAGLASKVKTLVGGAPVTERYAIEIGADGYASDAASAVDKAREFIDRWW